VFLDAGTIHTLLLASTWPFRIKITYTKTNISGLIWFADIIQQFHRERERERERERLIQYALKSLISKSLNKSLIWESQNKYQIHRNSVGFCKHVCLRCLILSTTSTRSTPCSLLQDKLEKSNFTDQNNYLTALLNRKGTAVVVGVLVTRNSLMAKIKTQDFVKDRSFIPTPR